MSAAKQWSENKKINSILPNLPGGASGLLGRFGLLWRRLCNFPKLRNEKLPFYQGDGDIHQKNEPRDRVQPEVHGMMRHVVRKVEKRRSKNILKDKWTPESAAAGKETSVRSLSGRGCHKSKAACVSVEVFCGNPWQDLIDTATSYTFLSKSAVGKTEVGVHLASPAHLTAGSHRKKITDYNKFDSVSTQWPLSQVHLSNLTQSNSNSLPGHELRLLRYLCWCFGYWSVGVK